MEIRYTDPRLENPQFLQEGCLPPRATLVPSHTKGVFFRNKEQSALVQSLNGDFRFAYTPFDCHEQFFESSYDDAAWDIIDVPSMWQYRGYGKPAYPNVEYPIPFDPPFVSCENPVGYYRKRFTARKTERTILYFGGVDNAYFVYLNGEYVGFSKGSRLPAEFDVSDKLQDGENLLCVKVFTYSDATYLENQDMLLTNGIFRDVLLFHLADPFVFDYHLYTDDDTVKLDVTLGGTFSGCAVTVEMDGQTITQAAAERLHFELTPEQVIRWNAEQPHLYTVYITLAKGQEVLEIHSKKIGFSKSRTEGNRLLLNDTPITLKGICRHEHDPHSGKGVSVALIEQELRNIKAHNFNAIRCAHYPNNPAFYEIASELGIYVMNEGDLETHGGCVVGDLGYLAKKPEWKEAYLNRTRRILERDKNESCVIIWSIGNEHGCGENIDACAALIREKTRNMPLMHTDDNGRAPQVSSFRADGYFTMESITSFDPQGAPVIMLEYGHAMGNSPGLMADTWDYVYKNRHIAGGYVWEYKNHGFEQHDADGNVFYQFGGDFGDYNHWSNFNMDGYCLADGTPKPSLRDCKNVLSPCYVSFQDDEIRVLNTNDFKTLQDMTLVWEVAEDYTVLRSGRMTMPSVKPYEECVLPLDLSLPQKTAGASYFLNLRFYNADGSENAVKQVLLDKAEKASYVGRCPEVEVITGYRRVTLINEKFTIAFENGLPSYYELCGKVLLEKPMKLNFYRAPTDNDGVVGWEERWIAQWNQMFLKHFAFRAQTVTVENESDCVRVTVQGGVQPLSRFVGFDVTLTYRVYADGLVLVEYVGDPFGVFKDVLPRIGVMFEADERFDSVQWYGRGEDENYCDRKAHCPISLYKKPIADMNFLYDVPQECGNREDTSFVQLLSKDGALTVIGSDSFAFSCHDFSLQALENARHRNELVRSPQKYLYIDYKMRGLGSHSCGPNPEECYELHPHTFRFAFALCGESDPKMALDLARSRFCVQTEALSDTYRGKIERTRVNAIECDRDRDN